MRDFTLQSISLVFEAILEWACITRGVYSKVGVNEIIYGKHVAPGKDVNWKSDAIMQIEANLVNNV